MNSGRIDGVSHVSIQVADMDRALAFYRDLLGFQVTIERREVIDTAGLQQIARATPSQGTTIERRAVYLQWDVGPRRAFIVLGQRLDGPPLGAAARFLERGIDHVGFWVDDLDAIVARIARAAEGEILMPSATYLGEAYGYPGEARIKTAFLRDPDDTIVQLDQWL